jgi:hypothetical protein
MNNPSHTTKTSTKKDPKCQMGGKMKNHKLIQISAIKGG